MRRRLIALLALCTLPIAATAGGEEAPGLRDFGTPDGFIRAGSGRAQMSIDGWNHMRIDYDHAQGGRTHAVYDIWFPMLCPPGRPYTSGPYGVLRIPFRSPLPFIDCQPTYDGRFFVNRVPQGELGYRSRGWTGLEPEVFSQFVTYVDPDGIWFELVLGN